MRGTKLYAIVAAAFVAGAFLASPELRAYAAATIGSADIINESILSEDIKNGQVKASDIATDAVGSSEIAANAVGASELAGVSKLLFGQCDLTDAEASKIVFPGKVLLVICTINGVDDDDSAIATLSDSNLCFAVTQAGTGNGAVGVYLRNLCTYATNIGSQGNIGIIVYDK
ncbi:MAG: hypothetical protein ACREBU_13920 [Nitrososphaera sp.]